jgi:hypothetical protein
MAGAVGKRCSGAAFNAGAAEMATAAPAFAAIRDGGKAS